MLKRLKKANRDKVQASANSNVNNEKTRFSLESLKNLKIAHIPYNELIKEGFFAGIGWAFGVTIGFVLISTFIVFILRYVDGLPLIGGWFADIIQETQNQLLRRTPVFN